jgi:hypothetical protein
MKNQNFTAEHTIDRVGQALARRLDRDGPDLSYDIGERLRAARMQALAARKPEWVAAAPPEVHLSAGQATLSRGGESDPVWSRWASFLPLVALIFGLIAIQSIQSESSILEIAEVDAALLVDELPPAAYTDPGFLQFLKSNPVPAAQVN